MRFGEKHVNYSGLRWLALSLVLLSTASVDLTLAQPQQLHGDSRSTTPSTIFDQRSLFAAVDQLGRSMPLSKLHVEKTLGIKLHPDTSVHMEGNLDRDIFVSDQLHSGLVSKIRLELFRERTIKSSGMLDIALNDNEANINETNVRTKYGKPSSVSVGPVSDIPVKSQPTSLSYSRKWGILFFHVDKTNGKRLESILLRAFVDPPPL
jgi:hypothetical protein